MLLQTGTAAVLDETATRLLADLTDALPAVIAGVVFLAVAGAGVLLVLRVLRAGLALTLPAAEPAYRLFVTRVVAVFLWFGVVLGFLAILGLGQIAAALGTASGFVALGISYALSGMIADAVAGIYLLRDPDFNPGDEVEVGEMTGVVRAIELRKTRFAVDGDTVVRGNATIEQRWTKRGPTPD